MKKRTGKMISLSLAVAMAVTAAPVTALADENTQSNVIEASELTTAQNEGETETGTTTVDTNEEVGLTKLEPATVVAAPVVDGAATAGDVGAATLDAPVVNADEVTVNNGGSLRTAVTSPDNAGKTIKLAANITLSSPLEITVNNITLDGDGTYTLKASDAFSGDDVVTITGDGVKLMNLTVDGNNKNTRHGIQFYTAENGVVENVISKNNKKAGLHVNASSVTAKGTIDLSSNEWEYINVGFGSGITSPTSSSLDITEATLTGVNDIHADQGDVDRATEKGGTISVTDGNNNFIGFGDIPGNPVCFVPEATALANAKITVKKGDNIFCYAQTTSLKDAIENAESGSTVTLAPENYGTDNITFDGKDLTITAKYPAYSNGTIVEEQKQTKFGGTFNTYNGTNDDSFKSNQKIVIEGISFYGDGLKVGNNNYNGVGNLTVKNCYVALGNNLSSPTLYNAQNYFVKTSHNDTAESATVTLEENYITGTPVTDVYPVQLWKVQNVDITDNIFNLTTADTAIQVSKMAANANAVINNNTIKGADNAIKVTTWKVPGNEYTGSVEVSNNTITSTIASPIFIGAEDGNATFAPSKFISSGNTNNNEPTTPEIGNPADNITLYTVTVKDGSTVIDVASVSNSYILPAAPASSRTFRGWYNSEDGKTYQPKEDVNITKDTTFTAQWKSSGGSSHSYDGYITIINPKNGEVSVSDDWAYEDDKITLTITPDDGYEVDKIEIVDDEGDKIDAKKVDDEDNKYTFRMANCDVTVTVTFKEEGKTTEDTDKEEGKDDEETTELNFTDVKESDWFFKGVEYVVDKDIMSGVSENEFAPAGKLTRAMLVQMLYNMESRPACDAENAFMDVPVGQWYTDAVIWANDAKIVSGMGEGLFAPNMEITREQMVVMLYNYAKYKGYDVTASAGLSKFADNASVSTWAQPAMQWAVAEGYISGMGDSQLAPQGTATRAEIASVIMRFMEATAESAETAE